MSITRAADLVLRRIVPTVRAGACVPENGQSCYACRATRYECESRRVVRYFYRATYDCNGICRQIYCYKQRTQEPC